MKTKYTLLLAAYFLLLLFPNKGYAQKGVAENMAAPASAIIDGTSAEWPENMFSHNKASQVSYLIANNDSTLFLVIKGDNPKDLRRLLAGGISISVNTKGERKEGQTLVFPIMPPRYSNADGNRSVKQSRDPVIKLKEELGALREIDIKGFDLLLDGKISVDNEYGIKAAAGLNETGFLVCEYALPLKWLSPNLNNNDTYAFQIKIRGLNLMPENESNRLRMAMPGIRGGFPTKTPYGDTMEGTDFWVLSRLKK